MFILTPDGEIEEGIELSSEELEVIKHFNTNITKQGCYFTSSEKAILNKFLLKHYVLKMRREAHQPLAAEAPEMAVQEAENSEENSLETPDSILFDLTTAASKRTL